MAGGTNATSVRRRVRTGCLTCRNRRRKCDEAKPSCNNCVVKNLVCRYPSRFQFVETRSTAAEGNVLRSPRATRLSTVTDIQPVPSGRIDRHVLDGRGSEDQVEQEIEQQQPGSHGYRTIIGYEAPTYDDPVDEQTQPSCNLRANLENNDHRSDDRFQSISNRENVEIPEHVYNGQLLDEGIELHADAEPITFMSRQGTNHTSGLHIEDTLITDQNEAELELISHYRYHIAPQLDLGIGTLYFGVRLLLESVASNDIRATVLALAQRHRANTMITDTLPAYRDGEDRYTITDPALSTSSGETMAVEVLLLWKNMLVQPPSAWFQMTQNVDSKLMKNIVQQEQLILVMRILLAAELTTPSFSQSHVLSTLWRDDQNKFRSSESVGTPHSQLQHALTLLRDSLDLSTTRKRSIQAQHKSLVATWQSCWHACQTWHARRTEEVREILCIMQSATSASSPILNDTDLPIIIFSNALATVSNIVHHLTAMLLLQHKPRMIKVIPGSAPTTSIIWQAQRITGIAYTARDTEIWDPVVIAALLHASRRLSHNRQLSAVTDLLKKAATNSGMQLNEEIEKVSKLSHFKS